MSPGSASAVIEALDARALLDLVAGVCRAHGVTLDELCGRARTRAASCARHEAWWQLRHHPRLHYSLADIGRLFQRDHTTIRHGIEAHQVRFEEADR